MNYHGRGPKETMEQIGDAFLLVCILLLIAVPVGGAILLRSDRDISGKRTKPATPRMELLNTK